MEWCSFTISQSSGKGVKINRSVAEYRTVVRCMELVSHSRGYGLNGLRYALSFGTQSNCFLVL